MNPQNYLYLSALLFTIGAAGVLLRRNAIVMFMCIELMLNAVNLLLVAFARLRAAFKTNDAALAGHAFVVFVLTVAAAEAAVVLAMAVLVYRRRETVELDRINLMRW